jgi:hypothetical protein
LRCQIQKRVKLRNNEYYNHLDITDNLYEKSSKNYNFYNLMDLILDKNNIELAYRNIKNNKGSNTALILKVSLITLITANCLNNYGIWALEIRL